MNIVYFFLPHNEQWDAFLRKERSVPVQQKPLLLQVSPRLCYATAIFFTLTVLLLGNVMLSQCNTFSYYLFQAFYILIIYYGCIKMPKDFFVWQKSHYLPDDVFMKKYPDGDSYGIKRGGLREECMHYTPMAGKCIADFVDSHFEQRRHVITIDMPLHHYNLQRKFDRIVCETTIVFSSSYYMDSDSYYMDREMWDKMIQFNNANSPFSIESFIKDIINAYFSQKYVEELIDDWDFNTIAMELSKEMNKHITSVQFVGVKLKDKYRKL